MLNARTAVLTLAAAGLAAAALTGCSTPSTAAEPPAASPAKAGSTPEPVESTGTTEPKTKSTTPKRAGDKATKAPWTRVDFENMMFGSLNCREFEQSKGKAEITGKTFADLTGDGHTEAIIVAKCFTGIGGNPVTVEVLEGDDTRWPKSLLTVGEDVDLASAEVKTSGRTITITAHGRSAKAPMCCPDRLIVQAYRWRDGEFQRTRSTVDPL